MLGLDQAGGENTAEPERQDQGMHKVIFVHGDQKAFTFRCFPDMNIQHPY